MKDHDKRKVVVLDMQPIDPPIGGGRIRLLGLYHNLGVDFSTEYIGTYDWPGENFRDHMLSDSLREIDIPLSEDHFAASRKLQNQLKGKTVIDSTFHQLAHLSKEYVKIAKEKTRQAEIIIFSHPWVFPLVKDEINPETQLVIYDSQNVEGYLKYTLLDDNNGIGNSIVREVVRIEFELCHFADKVLVCSQEDKELFNRLYSVPFQKMKVVPNCTFTEKIKPVEREEKKRIRQKLGLMDQWTTIFLGSNFGPNLQACEFICKELAPNLPEVKFIIAGGVGEFINKKILHGLSNVKVTGHLTEEEKLQYLSASDYAINPMFSGSGTNIKMFDFLAAGLPVLTTRIGARGIAENDTAGILVRGKSRFIATQKEILGNSSDLEYFARANRELAEQHYSWEQISPQLGLMLTNDLSHKPGRLDQDNAASTPNKIALMSSWDMRCGIAEHSRHLIEELEKIVDLHIISNTNTDAVSLYTIEDIPRNVHPLWVYDFLRWRDSKIDTEGIINLLVSRGISKFNIQYHIAFYNQEMLLDLLKECIGASIDVTLTLHNSKGMHPVYLQEISKLNVNFIVHTPEEETLLNNLEIKKVYNLPLGIQDYPDEDSESSKKALELSGRTVIGSFGFLRPHKGILEAIELISILRKEDPNIFLLGINSLYPSEDSNQYLEKCRTRIEELELSDNIRLITDFLEMKDIVRYLHSADIVLLPYHESNEGASAAANAVIAAKRPLIMSKSTIFNVVRNVGYVLDSIEPEAMAPEVQAILSNPLTINELKNKTINYLKKYSYAEMANKYIRIMGLPLPAYSRNENTTANYETTVL